MVNVQEHYQQVQEAPNISRGRHLHNRQIESFLEGLNLREIFRRGEACLDVGCGQGFVISDLAARFGVIPYGVDLEQQRENTAQGITFQTALAESLPFEDNFFEACFSYFTFQYTPDRLRAVSEAHRVLRMGGVGVLDFDDAISSDGQTRLSSKYTNPGLLKICTQCDPSNQMRVEAIPILEASGRINRYSQRVVLTKKSEVLQFPELKDFHTATSGPPFAYSYY